MVKQFGLYCNGKLFGLDRNENLERGNRVLANMNFGKIITLIALLIKAFTDHKAPQESTTKNRNYSNKSKIKRKKSRINYYVNCVATFDLALSGDIELNPGPDSNAHNNRTKYSLCKKGVGATRNNVFNVRNAVT